MKYFKLVRTNNNLQFTRPALVIIILHVLADLKYSYDAFYDARVEVRPWEGL